MTATAVAPQARELTLLDRCDRCRAAALVLVQTVAGELTFCGHHARAVEPKLRPLATDWSDQSGRILSR